MRTASSQVAQAFDWLTETTRCRTLNGWPSELNTVLKNLIWYSAMTCSSLAYRSTWPDHRVDDSRNSRCDIWALRVCGVMKPTHWCGGGYSPPPTKPAIFQTPPSLTKQSWAPAGDVSATAGTKPTWPDGATTRSHLPAVLAVLWESSSRTRTKCMPSFSMAGAVAFGVSRTSTSGRNG